MIRFLARGLLFSFMALLLASCDSGNDSIDVPGKSTYNLTIATVDAATGAPSNVASAAAPLRVQATLLDSLGAPVGGATISFSATGVGSLGTTSAQTDGAGVARVALNAGTSSTPNLPTPGVVSARYRDPSRNLATAERAYSSMGDEASSGGGGGGGGPAPTNVLRMTMAALDATTRAPISENNKIISDRPGVLSVFVTLDGNPVPNALVTFSVDDVAELPQSTVATNALGVGEISILAKKNGAGKAKAIATVGTQTVPAEVVVSTAIVATPPVTLAIGNGAGAGFARGILHSSAGTTPVSGGSTITITADVVNAADNAHFETPVTVTFSSPCATAGTSSLDASALTVGGQARITYTPKNCTGTDTIRATLVYGSRTVTAEVNVSIEAPVLGQVRFVEADPRNIALAGTGGLGRTTRSEVTFQVLSLTGQAMSPPQLVCFELPANPGGGMTVNASTRTNSAGYAIATVQAGSVPTSVRVTARVDTDGDSNCATSSGTVVSAVSDVLTVSTGLPDQNSFSLAVSSFNPHGWNKFGTEVTVTAYAADHFNNPVPDGTAISFWSELGAIDPSCTTNRGICTVTWRSQEPRINFDDRAGSAIGANGIAGRAINDRLGRSTILAYAVGEESFTDMDGDGRFDAGEPYIDLAEALKDGNENGVRDLAGLASYNNEEFIDFNGNGVMNPANGRYDGVLCAVPNTTTCSGDATVNVRRSVTLVMSSSDNPRVYVFAPGAFNPNTVDYDRTTDIGAMTGIPPEISVAGIAVSRQSVDMVVTDENGNSLPQGYSIKAEITPTDAGKVSAATSEFKITSKTEYLRSTILLESGTSGVDGALFISVIDDNQDTIYTKTIAIDN